MFGENLKTLRKQKGMSQETLAQQLHVVRQTISKWEKGLSVPDADMLTRIAELFEVPVSDLLGSQIPEEKDINEIAVQLAVLNEQLANRSRRNRKLVKGILIGLAAIIGVWLLLTVLGLVLFTVQTDPGELTVVDMICTLDGEEYRYGVSFDKKNRIVTAGGDAWVADHVQTEQYGKADQLMEQVEDYFVSRGGSVEFVTESNGVEVPWP